MGRIITTMRYAELARLLLTDDVDPERGPRLVLVDVDDVTRDVRFVWEHEIFLDDDDGIEPTAREHVELIEAFMLPLDRILSARPRVLAPTTFEEMAESASRFTEWLRRARCEAVGRCPERGQSPYVAIPELLECGLPLEHDGDHVWEGVIDGQAARSTWSHG